MTKSLKFLALFMPLLLLQSKVSAGSPNANIKYYGYAWLDYYQPQRPSYSAIEALNAISTTGFSTTNLNVVHSVDNLKSEACGYGKCAIGISAGFDVGGDWLDICPGAETDEDCKEGESWKKIWDIVASIKTSSNLPSAVYFLDEPFTTKALTSRAGSYVKYQYASYVCTLRQAMNYHGLNAPIYTVLTRSIENVTPNQDDLVREIQNGVPEPGCPADIKSSPDWIGIDHYDNWSVPAMWAAYNRVAPSSNPNSPRWVLVPPASKQAKDDPFAVDKDDQAMHDQIQLYWDFINQYPNAPVVYVMNFRFDVDVILDRTTTGYPKSVALLSFMANSITPP